MSDVKPPSNIQYGYCRSIGKTLELYSQINQHLADNPSGICDVMTTKSSKFDLTYILPEFRDRVRILKYDTSG